MPYLVLLLVLLVGGCTASELEGSGAPHQPATAELIVPQATPTPENTLQLDGSDYTCSSFAISAHWAVTAAHCIIDGTVPVLLGDGPPRDVRQAFTHPGGRDVAVVEVERAFVAWFELSAFDAAEPGMAGYNGGYGCTGELRSARIVFGSDTTWTSLNCSGDSGGPVLDANGRAVGTLTHHERGRSGQVGVSLMAPLGDWRTWALTHVNGAPQTP